MEAQSEAVGINFDDHLRRSYGRMPRSFVASAKVTRVELDELEAAAREDGKKCLSEWAREVLLRAARKQEVSPAFTEIVATRMLLNTVLSKLACGEPITREEFNAQMQTIRTTKIKAAEEVMQQYTGAGKTR